jgi:hypothetical protein
MVVIQATLTSSESWNQAGSCLHQLGLTMIAGSDAISYYQYRGVGCQKNALAARLLKSDGCKASELLNTLSIQGTMKFYVNNESHSLAISSLQKDPIIWAFQMIDYTKWPYFNDSKLKH